MRIGIFAGAVADGSLDEVVGAAREAAAHGFASFWMPQIFGFDALTALAVIGREVERIELGTAVVPTYPRHPMMLAAQALTANVACGGRLSLGIGLSHQIVIEGMFGYSFEKPVRHMREYLSILMPLLRGEAASFTGETLTGNGTVAIKGAEPCPVLIAALGPKMLDLAGRVADGTVTWMTGPKTLGELTVPAITAAAADAGRPEPRVVGALPVCVTDDESGMRGLAAQAFAIYGQLPSYRAMLDREGAEGPADVALVGSEEAVRAGIERVGDAGATDFVAVEFAPAGTPERERTRDLLRTLI